MEMELKGLFGRVLVVIAMIRKNRFGVVIGVLECCNRLV